MTTTITCPLDPSFEPASVFQRDYHAAVAASRKGVRLVLGLERDNGLVSRYETLVHPDADARTARFVERMVKFLLWARGGWKLYVGGPKALGELVRKAYSPRGARKFDCEMMTRIYGKRFEVVVTTAAKVPAGKDQQVRAGGHLGGCRIGFDLGASDYKVCAVKDGDVVFSEETPWNPVEQANPDYHFHHLSAGLHRAATHLPRVDAIGGSSAGIIVANEIRVASLLRAVPRPLFAKAAKMFKRIQAEWKVPLTVMNDGDVTALAGALSLGHTGMLGIAMGSSEAAGFLDHKGRITGWINELAFAPVDYSPTAAVDPWSGDAGVGALYFSQQAVNKLLPAADITVPADLPLPERLLEVQRLMTRGDVRAAKIYETIGHYFGHAIAQYAECYDVNHLLILGRVTTGRGGDLVLSRARQVLATEFPEVADRVELHVPDEKSRRVGQAVAAASLPVVKGTR